MPLLSRGGLQPALLRLRCAATRMGAGCSAGTRVPPAGGSEGLRMCSFCLMSERTSGSTWLVRSLRLPWHCRPHSSVTWAPPQGSLLMKNFMLRHSDHSCPKCALAQLPQGACRGARAADTRSALGLFSKHDFDLDVPNEVRRLAVQSGRLGCRCT